MEAIIKNQQFEFVASGMAPDAKKRVSLSRALRDAGVTFNIYVNQLGQIILDPQKAVPAHEAWVFEDRKALASIKRGLKQAAQGQTRSLGSFAKFAREEE